MAKIFGRYNEIPAAPQHAVEFVRMIPPATRWLEWFEKVRRGIHDADLAWLRQTRLDLSWQADASRLFSDEGEELLADALQDRVWNADDVDLLARQCAWLAFTRELATARPLLAKLAVEPVALAFESEMPATLLATLCREPHEAGRELRARPLAQHLDAHALRLIEVRSQAQRAWLKRLPAAVVAAAPEVTPPAARDSEARPRTAALEEAGAPADGPSELERLASAFLTDTDDAAHDMVRWAARGLGSSRKLAWHTLLHALRAEELDGLAKPARRFWRLTEGIRQLGFERDMSARMRAEPGRGLLSPRARVVPLSVPFDVRVAQSGVDQGVMSDLFAARAIGEALGLALVSPALSAFARWPLGSSVAAVHGALFMQLRAHPAYLQRVEGMDSLIVERAARHAGLVVLLDARLHAALFLVERNPARHEQERAAQLSAAVERALDVTVPSGLAALAWFDAAPGGAHFEAAVAGFAVHAGLRERFNEDWYRNPRVAEVIRGACARGNTLAVPVFCDELGVALGSSVARALELLG